MNTQGGQSTGTSDVTYNLISVAYHALQGAENYGQYAQDAQQQGDRELADFFRQAQEQARQCADQAKQLLASRVQGGEAAHAGQGAAAGAMGHAGSKPQTSE
jgi:rubrerythrin